MNHYWARFRQLEGVMFRLDTRIYLQPIEKPGQGDSPIGCVVGKNPGSARGGLDHRRLTPMVLEGDRFLPNVLAVTLKAYSAAEVDIPVGGYIQVLNLFYLCDRRLANARRTLAAFNRPPVCRTEGQSFPWSWYVWGGPDRALNPLKKRFINQSGKRAFYYDGALSQLIDRVPDVTDKARHTQGLAHGPVVKHLAKLIQDA